MKCEDTCVTVDALHKAIGSTQIEYGIVVAELARWKGIPAMLRARAEQHRQRAVEMHEYVNHQDRRLLSEVAEAYEEDDFADLLERMADEAERIGRGQ